MKILKNIAIPRRSQRNLFVGIDHRVLSRFYALQPSQFCSSVCVSNGLISKKQRKLGLPPLLVKIQVLNLRDGFDFLFFSDGFTLLHSELDSLILYLALSRTLWSICCSVCVAFCVLLSLLFLLFFVPLVFAIPGLNSQSRERERDSRLRNL